MNREQVKEMLKLVHESPNVYVASIDCEGYPNIKCIFHRDHDGLSTFYLSSNLSSLRVKQFTDNPKSCLYFCKEEKIQALMLKGVMEVCTDLENRERIWKDTDAMYYPEGVNDPDYCVLRFRATEGKYWNYGKRIDSFSVEEAERLLSESSC